jgi:predicted DNA-binding WGR domain protein
MEGFIIANGGEVAKTVTNKCTHLISAETGTKKCADAEKKGVIVVDEAWVREQCGEATEAMDEDDDEDDEDDEEEEEKAAKAKKTAVPSSGGTSVQEFVYMECDSSSGGKFWQCTLDGCETKVVFGKLGSSGVTQVKGHDSEAAAKKYFDKIGKEKVGKGYEPTVPDTSAPPPTTVPKKATVPKKGGVSSKSKVTAPAAKGGGAQSVHLVCASSSGGKFWECTVDGSNTVVTFGKVGTEGAKQIKNHGDDETASKFFDKMLKEKKKKGYC